MDQRKSSLIKRPLRPRHLLLAVIFLGIALRLFFLFNRGEFWIDEAISSDIAKYNVLDILSRLNKPINLETTPTHSWPPLYFILLHFWMLIGSSEIILRSFSLFFGAFSLVMMGKLAKENFGQRVAIVSVFLMAISPLNIYYSIECKPYSLFLFFCLLSAYYFLKIIKGQRNWLLYIITTGLSVYTFYYGLFLLLFQNIIFFIFFLRKDAKLCLKWFWVQSSIFLFISPLTRLFISNFTWLYPNFGFNHLHSFIMPKSFSAISGIFANLCSFYCPQRIYFPALAMFELLFIIGLISLIKRPGALFSLLIYFFLPLLMLFFVSGQIVHRAFIFLTPALYLILASGLLALKAKTRGLLPLGLCGIIIVNGLSIYNLYKIQLRPQDDLSWKAARQFLSQTDTEKSIMVLDKGKLMPLLNYYLPEKINSLGFLSPNSQHTTAQYRDFTEQCLQILSSKYEYLWIVYPRHHKKAYNLDQDMLSKYLLLMQTRDFREVEIMLWKKKVPGDQRRFKLLEIASLPVEIVPQGVHIKYIDIPESGKYSFYLTAKYSETKPFYANMALIIDGKISARQMVGSSFFYIYKFTAELTAGRHQIGITSLKDRKISSPDQKLILRESFLSENLP